MKSACFFTWILFIAVPVFSKSDWTNSKNQEIDSGKFQFKNSFQLELLGHGFLYSLNYERILINRPRSKTAIQVGAHYGSPWVANNRFMIPVLVNQVFSFGINHLELGVGHIFIFSDDFVPGFKIGYRRQKPNGRFVSKYEFTPFYYSINNVFIPWLGVSFGYNF